MQEITGPTDVIIDGNVLRVNAGQVAAFPDYAVADPTTHYDEYEAASQGPDATFVSIGEEVEGKFSAIKKNPGIDVPEFWGGYDSPSEPWSYPMNIHAGKNYTYEGGVYMAIQSHVSQVDWAPPVVTPTLYVVIPADSSIWEPGVSYAVDDEVTYEGNGLLYKCIQAHTSQVGWEPPNVPALWGLV